MSPVDERLVYAGVVVVLLAGTGIAVALGGNGGQTVAPPNASSAEYETTADGTRYTVHPSELLQGCPGGRDCIPSIDDPSFQSAEDADWLGDEDLVIGVEIDGESKAYPLRILNVHEVVNDELAGEPVAVTYCPLCRSGLVFSREVRNETLTFGVSGQLLDANLVLYDRQTGTYWSQIRGAAIVGPLVPTELDQHPSTITTWDEWRSAHPETRVLSRRTGIYPPERYGSNPYSGYAEDEGVGFGVDEVDPRLPSKEIVYGVAVGGDSTAYTESTVESRDLIQDEVGGVPVVVFEDPRDGTVRVYSRRVDGRVLNFSQDDGALVDGNGTRWSFDGEALGGPHEGTRLDRFDTHGFYWFAWSSFHPETDVYNGTG